MLTKCSLVFLALVAVLGFGQQPPASTPTSHEELVVRDTYGRLSFAARTGLLVHAAILHSDGWPGLDNEAALRQAIADQVAFELAGFQVGRLADVSQIRWTSLVTTFPNASIQVAYQDLPFRMESEHATTVAPVDYADVSWGQAPAVRGGSESSPTVVEALKGMRGDNGDWSRYASFQVTATLQGRSTTYQALFLFGADKKGTEVVLPIDYVVAATGLASFVGNPVYPTALLETAVREIPFVQRWIADNTIVGCKKTAVPEVCCDWRSARCGIAAEDAERSLKVPVDPDSRWFTTANKEDK